MLYGLHLLCYWHTWVATISHTTAIVWMPHLPVQSSGQLGWHLPDMQAHGYQFTMWTFPTAACFLLCYVVLPSILAPSTEYLINNALTEV
jgi:hypothetical protein